MKNWKPNSLRAKTAKHLPVYENESKCDGDPILPPYTSAEGRFVVGAGVAVIT